MRYLPLACIITLTSALNSTYNILALDGGGIRGIIAATILDHMEIEAYSYALDQGYIKENVDQRLSMGNLFDMVSGTSTGSILAAGLVFPKEAGSSEPMYFADDMRNMY